MMNEHVIIWLWNRYWTVERTALDGSDLIPILDAIEQEAQKQIDQLNKD